MALKAWGKRAIQAFVDEGKLFSHETIKGRLDVDFGFGKLPEPFRSQLDELGKHNLIDRVLYSYRTPIAWRTNEGVWVVPDVSYSVTTSNHQGVARVAIGNFGFYKNTKW